MSHHIIVAVTSANTLMARYTNKEVSSVLAVYKRFPPYVLAQSSPQLSEDERCYFHHTDVDDEAHVS